MSNSNATASSRSPRDFPLSVTRARALNEEIRQLLNRRRADLAAVAHRLRAIQQGELYRALGYTSVYVYAREEHGFGKSKVCDLIGISRESERLPGVREAFDGGGLNWTKAREIAKVATPETEREWLERAETSTSEDLRDQRQGKPKRIRRGFAFSPQEAARFDQLLAGIRSEQRGVSDAQAVLILLERGASGEGGQAPVRRIVINECPSCQRVTLESREGPVPLGAGDLAVARCGGEVHDLREEENQVKRAIPAGVRRRVVDRDRRCLVPGCRALGGLDVHHEDGWKAGHHAERMLTLCSSHHRERHEGYLRIEGSYPEFRFLGLDGARYGEALRTRTSAARSEFADENSGSFADENSGSFADENSGSKAGEASGSNGQLCEIRECASRGLESLGLRTREAKFLIQRALRSESREGWTVEGLLGAALRAA